MTQHHLVLAAFAVLAVLFLLLLRRLVAGAREQKDPQRDFTAAQRRAIFTRAGNRCEQKHWLFGRCSAKPTHADHIYPHSKGGATSLANAQAMCARHNLAKSNHVPSRFYIHRLERRRERYFTDHSQIRVEHRIGVASYY